MAGTAVSLDLVIPLDKGGGVSSGDYTTWTVDETSPLDCADGDVTTGLLTLTPLLDTHNEDGAEFQSVLGIPEYCADWEELAPLGTGAPEGPNAPGKQGDARDPFNPYDFYDTDGDGVVTLTHDINGVIARYGTVPGGPPNPDTGLSYAIRYDRGVTLGPKIWNKDAPDGFITLQDDILGVINQYGHTCAAAPLTP